jgi:hypothetical protein
MDQLLDGAPAPPEPGLRAVVPLGKQQLPVPVAAAKPSKRSRWQIALPIAVVLFAASGGGYYWWKQTHPVLPAGISFGNGRIEADEIDIDTKYAGRVSELLVDIGDMVAPGQVLARMDTRDLQQSLAKSEAQGRQAQRAVEEAQANLAQQQTQQTLAVQEMDRTRALLQNGWTTKEIADQRQQQLDAASAALTAAQARISQAQHALEASQHDAGFLGHDVTWLSWLVAAAPFSVVLSIGLYVIMMTMMPPEAEEVPGGQAAVERSLSELGPMTGKQARLLAISLILLCFWATEGLLHSFDSATTTTVAVALLFLPGVGVMDWRTANPLIPWGTIVLFGVGISLGTALLQTQAAQWLANLIVEWFGLNQLPALAILAVMAAFLVIVHLGFASATALASSLIPIVIAVLQKVQASGINVLGMTLVLQFVVSFGFILPVNSPQGMVAYGTETFVARDFVRTGIAITVLAYLLTLLFGATYWRWLGYV